MDETPKPRMFNKTRARIEKLEETNKTFHRVSTHLQENGQLYLVGGGCLVMGYFARGHAPVVKQVAKNTALIQTNPQATNIAVTQLTRRGHPGNIVKCIDTGEVFASQRRAAQATGVHPFELYKHLNGQLDTAGGHIFEKLGEAS